MGFISIKIFPVCGSMCVCCPALRSRSRHPVKRYKKLLAEIFPKSLDGAANERKIVKLCEYAAKNPFRIPKIAKYLEERCYKELRYEHIKFINIITDTYNKLLCLCKVQMACFAVSLLKVVDELLDNSKQDALRILGCQTLTRFIYSQVDATYTHNIENFVCKVSKLAQESGEDHQKRTLRASSLQCITAMVWFMAEFSHIFVDFDEIVRVTLENYESDAQNQNVIDGVEPHHNWVNEVVRSEGRGTDTNPSCTIIRPRPEKKDTSLLTREEIETPKAWAQICIQRMAEFAEESTTIRRVLDPMFVYFDSGRHWVSQQGLALTVLSDLSYLMESSGNQQLILASVIHHLDHKDISQNLVLKSHVIQVATTLARQIRPGMILGEIGSVCDLCRHLRKSLQATFGSVGEQELNLNISLQACIEDCLLEISKGIGDARPLYDMMAITLEKLPSGAVARATIGSIMILAHVISLASVSSHSQQVFPETLLVQIVKLMLHSDPEARIGAHRIFSVLLFPSSGLFRHEVASVRSGFCYEQTGLHSNTPSASAAITALLEKLRREKGGTKIENLGDNNIHDIVKEEDHFHKNSPSFYKISSIIDKKAGPTSLPEEPCTLKFNEDQIAQLLSAFWIQANLPDNVPSNIEAIANSFILTLISARLKSPNENLLVRFFQLPISLRNISLDPNHGTLPPACQRSLFVLSMGMLMFTAKLYNIPHLNHLLKSLVPCDVDPYLGVSNNLRVYLKTQADLRDYGSVTDNHRATSFLLELRSKIYESDNIIRDTLVQNLSIITELDRDELDKQLSEPFTPDDAFMFGPKSMMDFNHNKMASHSKESLSFDGDLPSSSVEGDTMSEASVADISRFIPKVPPSPSISHIIGIAQLLESALEVAGQVAGTSVSTSPLPYNTMASQCEALGTGTRTKLSNWLAQEKHHNKVADRSFSAVPANRQSALQKIMGDASCVCGPALPADPCLAMKLPPASPFDNFLKAARC